MVIARTTRRSGRIGFTGYMGIQGGSDYYVVAMRLPEDEKIYDAQEVIDMMNAHPVLRGMNRQGPTTMLLNGKAWEGLK